MDYLRISFIFSKKQRKNYSYRFINNFNSTYSHRRILLHVALLCNSRLNHLLGTFLLTIFIEYLRKHICGNFKIWKIYLLY
jgi:hypothetical protein